MRVFKGGAIGEGLGPGEPLGYGYIMPLRPTLCISSRYATWSVRRADRPNYQITVSRGACIRPVSTYTDQTEQTKLYAGIQ